jgi:Fe-S oxidoreductase
MPEIDPEIMDIIKEEGADVFKACYQCGTCTGICPWNQVSRLPVRRIIHQAQLGLVDFENEDLWKCVSCNLCVQSCPRGVEIPDVMRALRRVIVEIGAGSIPHSLQITAKNITAAGNPLGESPEKRIDWTRNLDIKPFISGMEVLLFPCCYQSLETRAKKVIRSATGILKKAQVNFGILGNEQSCCGESIRKLGYENSYCNLERSNNELLKAAGARKIVVTSPHCYNSLKQYYENTDGNIEIIHIVQYYLELIQEGRLTFAKNLDTLVTYHDSCYLGRHANIYDAPRQVLQSIPGLKLVEMRDNHEKALCCGGGSGGLWRETKKEERLADSRLDQAIETGAHVLSVACPYCMVMFEDSALTKNYNIKIKDITEILEEVI